MAEFIKLYTLKEVSAIVKVSVKGLYTHIKAGKLKARRLGREWRVTQEALKEYVETGTRD
jgi:excisionase family DNA binding protein